MEAAVDLGKERDRALARAAVAALASRAITSLAAVTSLGLAAQALTKPEVGVVAVLTMLVLLVGLGDLGLGTLVMSRLPAANAKGGFEAGREVVSGVLSTLLTVGTFLGVVGLASAFVVPWRTILGAEDLSESGVRTAVICFVVFGALTIPASFGIRVLAAMQRSATMHVWLASAGILSMILTVVAFAADLPMWAYVVAISGPNAVLGAIQTVFVLTRVFPQLRPRTLRVPRAEKLALLKSGGWFAALSLSAVASFYIDSLVISAVRGADDAAVFAIAARMFALVGGTLSIAGQQMWSALADALARGDTAWARRRFRHVLVFTLTLNAAACLVLVTFGQTIARLWVGEDLVPPMSLLVALGVWTVISTAMFQANYILAAVERIQLITTIGVLSAPINVLFSTLATRELGLPGPTIGSLATAALVLIGPTIVLNRRELLRERGEVHPAPPVTAAPAGPILWASDALVVSTPEQTRRTRVGQHPEPQGGTRPP